MSKDDSEKGCKKDCENCGLEFKVKEIRGLDPTKVYMIYMPKPEGMSGEQWMKEVQAMDRCFQMQGIKAIFTMNSIELIQPRKQVENNGKTDPHS